MKTKILPWLLCLFLLLPGCGVLDIFRMPTDGTTVEPVDPPDEDTVVVPVLPAVKGFRFILIEDGPKRQSLGKQANVITSTILRKYLKDHCAKQSDGKTSDYHFVDKTDAFDDSGNCILPEPYLTVQKKRPVKSYPWLIGVNGKKATSKAVPLTVDETIQLIQPVAESK